MPLHFLALKIELPLKRVDEIMPRPDRQLRDFGIFPVKPAIGEEEGIFQERTPGNKKDGSASSFV